MYPSVASRWRVFNTPIEGLVSHMYLDKKGLVTIGMGNLIDPLSVALELPFRRRRTTGVAILGSPATKGEIGTEWKLIKGKKELAQKGYRACDPLCNLMLDATAIDQLIRTKLMQNENFMKRQKPFTKFDEWPADAQMGLLSMAWALGPGFGSGWPLFSAACEKMDFLQAGSYCTISEAHNPGVHPRNVADKMLFHNAAVVLGAERDKVYRKEVLYYPTPLKPL